MIQPETVGMAYVEVLRGEKGSRVCGEGEM